jgi:hypothetical protein
LHSCAQLKELQWLNRLVRPGEYDPSNAGLSAFSAEELRGWQEKDPGELARLLKAG